MILCMQILLMALGTVTIACIVNYWLIIPTIAIFILFYKLRQFYIKPSRSIRRMEAKSRPNMSFD